MDTRTIDLQDLRERYRAWAVDGIPYVYRGLPGALIRRMQQRVAAALTRQFEAHGSDLTPMQYTVLAGVYIHAPAIEQGALADNISYDRATIGGVVDRLEKKELVQRQPSPVDRRVRLLTISDAGVELLERLEPAVLLAQDEILDPLTERQRDQLTQLLRRIVL
ncbi:MAG: MarR family transcriptional regulator [Pigmentiphaga sp.]|nr:MarR family transcriptional regulator [Pigmentiphaga sp.]